MSVWYTVIPFCEVTTIGILAIRHRIRTARRSDVGGIAIAVLFVGAVAVMAELSGAVRIAVQTLFLAASIATDRWAMSESGGAAGHDRFE